MTEKELLNEIDHRRRAMNAMSKKILMLENDIHEYIQKMQELGMRANFWQTKYAELHNQIEVLLAKYEQEALEHEKV